MQTQTAPFNRGATYYKGGSVPSSGTWATDAGESLLGLEEAFSNMNTQSTTGTATVRTRRDQQDTVMKLVRNNSGIALLPGYAVTYKSGYYGQRVDGYSTTEAQNFAGIVDDQLPAAGVPDGDIFWITVKGPTLWKSPLGTTGFNTTVAQGDCLFALTAVTSQATTAGRWGVQPLTFTATQCTDGTAGKVSTSLFARAISAALSTQTNTNILVDVIRRH